MARIKIFQSGNAQNNFFSQKLESVINGSIATKKCYQRRLSLESLNALFLPSRRGVVTLFVSTLNGFQLRHNFRLQNSPNFCVFKYARAVKQKVWNEAENREPDWGETLFFSLASHALRTCEARALRARKTLTPPFTNFFTDFEKTTDCFAV